MTLRHRKAGNLWPVTFRWLRNCEPALHRYGDTHLRGRDLVHFDLVEHTPADRINLGKAATVDDGFRAFFARSFPR